MKFTPFQIVALLAVTTAAFPVGTNNEAASAKPLKQRDFDDGLSLATGHQHRRRQSGRQGKGSKMSKAATMVKNDQASTPSPDGSTAGSAGGENPSTGASSHTYSQLDAAQKFSPAPKGIKPGQTVPVAGQKSTKSRKGSKSAAPLGKTGSQHESAMMASTDLSSAGSGMAGGRSSLTNAPNTAIVATDATTKGLDGGIGESPPYTAKPSYAEASDDTDDTTQDASGYDSGPNPNSPTCVCPSSASSTTVDSVGTSDSRNCTSTSDSGACSCICPTPDPVPPSYYAPDSSGNPTSPSYVPTTEEDCDPEETTDSKESTDDEAAPTYESSTATDGSMDTSTDPHGQDGGIGEPKKPEEDATEKSSEAAPSYAATEDDATQNDTDTDAAQPKEDATGKLEAAPSYEATEDDAAQNDTDTDADLPKEDATGKLEAAPSYDATEDVTTQHDTNTDADQPKEDATGKLEAAPTDAGTNATQPEDTDSKQAPPSYATPETDDTTKHPAATDAHADAAVTPAKPPTQPKDTDSKQAPPSYATPETDDTTKHPAATDAHAKGAVTPAKTPADATKPAPPSYDPGAAASGGGSKPLFKRVDFTA